MKSQDLLNDFSIKWNSTINDIPVVDWKLIFGEGAIKSTTFFSSMEKSNFAGVKYFYLQVHKHGVIAAIVPCFCYEINVLNIVTSSAVQKLIHVVRLLFPRFLIVKTFGIGTYVASCEHFIGINSCLSDKDQQTLFLILNKQLKTKSKESSSKFILIKDIRERSINFTRRIMDADYSFFSSFPTTAIPILPNYHYPNALKSKYRKRYKDYQKAFDDDFIWETCTDFCDYAGLFTELYKNVLCKASNKFELLNADFFNNINLLFPNSSFLLIAKDKNKKIRLMVLILEDTYSLIPLYLGIKYEEDDTRILYINMLGKLVEEGEIRKKSFIDLGQTSYYPKVMSGALVENIYYGFWSDHWFFNWLIKNVFPKMFVPPKVHENTYLNNCKSLAVGILKSFGFALMNG